MLSIRRVALPMALAAIVGAVCVVLLAQSPANARRPLSYGRLNKIQKRIISQTLASALNPASAGQGRSPRISGPGTGDGDQGAGPDGAPFTPPASFSAANGGSGSAANYFPTNQGQCASRIGGNVKVNQNCLNVTDPSLQGRGQANNEPAISQDPMDPGNIVASDNNYLRGDGTCGAHFSTDGGRTWADSTVPNGFTVPPGSPPPFAREYWQAGGDTSLGWDTRGNAYMSCQLFNRGTVASANPDESSAFTVFRSTQNNGASWNFPGRYTTLLLDPNGTSGVLEDKALMAVDDNLRSPYRDRIYVTWTEFAADGTAYIYEVHSSDYGESFSNRVLVSSDSPDCTNTFGAATTQGKCNENQYSDPFVGPDGALYVVYSNFNNQPTSGTNNNYQVLLSKSTDGGQTFSSPVKVSNYYDLPDCDTYQGAGADPGRACVPEKGSSNISVFRATNYASGQVDPHNANKVTVAFGSYVNPDSNETNGCTPAGFSASGNPTYDGVKAVGGCANKIMLGVSKNGGASFATSSDPRQGLVVTQSRGQAKTDQFFQWSAFTRSGQLAVDYYDRQYGRDETNGSSDFSLSGSSDLVHFGQVRVTSSSMPAPTEFEGPAGGQFYGDYVGLAAIDKAHPIWSDTRSQDVFLCPGTATPGTPPALCGAKETNGEVANDEDTFTASVNVPSGNGH
jgi:hypothetical protein